MGPFVDSAGRLDLTRAGFNDTDFYRCTGVDVAGGSGFQIFRVEIVVGDGEQTSLVMMCPIMALE